MTPNDTATTDLVKKKLQYWANQLNDMGRRNRLLFFRETRTSSLVISEPKALDVFERLVVSNKSIYSPLPPTKKKKGLFDELEDDTEENEEEKEEYVRKDEEFLSTKTIEQVNRVLNSLRYKARTIREEQGFNALYMGFGVLKWQEGISSEFSEAPLVLVPIDITRDGLGARFEIKLLEEETVINPTLQAKLEKDFNVELPDIEDNSTEENLNVYWQQVEKLVENYSGWEVLPKAVLAIFNFQTLMLIKDLEVNEEYFSRHPLIQMLSGGLENLLEEPNDVPSANDLDEKVDPQNVFQILDADSSQQEAVEAAKKGISFVLQGPPGTGKSQTIANIIAESMAAGKKILFVSQKSVALDVVHNRLSQHGLGEFCLEVHSYKKSKKDVIQDLGKALSARKGEITQNTTQKKQEIKRLRNELNELVKEHHTLRFEIKLSLFRALGELSKLYESPNLKFSLANIEKIDREKYEQLISTVREIASYREVIEHYSTYPWIGFKLKTSTIQDREEIAEKFEELAQILLSFTSSIQEIAEQLSLTPPETVNECFAILNVIRIFKTSVFGEEFGPIVERFSDDYHSISRILRPQYWKDISRLRKESRIEEKIPFDKLLPRLKILKKIRVSAIDTGLKPGGDYDLSSDRVRGLEKKSKDIVALYKFSITLFDKEKGPEILNSRFQANANELAQWFEERGGQTAKIPEWVNFSSVTEQAEAEGLGDFVKKILEEEISADQWVETYKRRFYVLLSDKIIETNLALSKFRSSAYNNTISRFRELDNELIELSSLEIREKLYAARPETTWVQSKSAETTILRKELNKQRRIKPLRLLFSEIPNLLLSLKPCLMMSPLTVSQLLDPEIFEFDIAIFDEASQIPPEYCKIRSMSSTDSGACRPLIPEHAVH
jgi:hypothetical protein